MYTVGLSQWPDNSIAVQLGRSLGVYGCQTKGRGVVVLKHLHAAACCDRGRPWRACRGHCCQDKEVWLCHRDFGWRGLLLTPTLPEQEAKRLHLDLMTASGVAVTAGGPTAPSVDGGADGDGDNGGGDAAAVALTTTTSIRPVWMLSLYSAFSAQGRTWRCHSPE